MVITTANVGDSRFDFSQRRVVASKMHCTLGREGLLKQFLNESRP